MNNINARPYVYRATCKDTSKFYIGMRSANTVPAIEDIGIIYFTSCNTIKSNPYAYNYEVIAEFDTIEETFAYENMIIKNEWNNDLILNKHYQNNMSTFSMKGFKRPDVSELNRKRLSKPKEIRYYECGNCKDNIKKVEFVHHERKLRRFCSRSCARVYQRGVNIGKKIEHPRKKYVKKFEGEKRIPWNKGLTKENDARIQKYSETLSNTLKNKSTWGITGNSGKTGAANGRAGAAKLSKKAKGRKRKYLDDGSWTWEYPKNKEDISILSI